MVHFLFLCFAIIIDNCLQQNISLNTKNITENSTSLPRNITNVTTPATIIRQNNVTTPTTPVTTTPNQNNITTTSAPVLNATEININNEKEPKQYSNKEDFCTCDLQESICDINCCCDSECRWIDKSIFSHCEEKGQRSYDTRFCEYSRYLYINNTPTTWKINQNGLFCVVSSNLPKSYMEQRPKRPLKTYNDARLEKNRHYDWPKQTVITSEEFTRSTYLYGKNIWVIRNNKFITKLNIPQNLVTSACNTLTTVSFLKNFKNVCVQTSLNKNNQYLNAETYFRNISVIGVPKNFILSKYNNTFQSCPRNVCIEIVGKNCNSNFESCTNITWNQKFVCDELNNSIIPNCYNAVDKVFYKFYHNGTKGISKVEVLLHLVNLTALRPTILEQQCLSQEFKVNFYWFNETITNFSNARSGNPGYIVGKPILSGQLLNNYTVWNLTRNFNDVSSNFLTLAENVNGFCKLDNYTHILVEFGYNIATKCKITYSYKTPKIRNTTTATNICKNIQAKIFLHWSIIEGVNSTYINISVGQWGNSNQKNKQDWVDVIYNKSPEIVINTTTGDWLGKYNDTLICRGLVTDLNIDIYHSRWLRNSLSNQERVLAVTYTFSQLVNNTINTEQFDLELRAYVMFYDVTAPSKKKFVDPPSLDIKLPYDFFYPFVKIDNKSTINLINFKLVFLGLIVYYV